MTERRLNFNTLTFIGSQQGQVKSNPVSDSTVHQLCVSRKHLHSWSVIKEYITSASENISTAQCGLSFDNANAVTHVLATCLFTSVSRFVLSVCLTLFIMNITLRIMSTYILELYFSEERIYYSEGSLLCLFLNELFRVQNNLSSIKLFFSDCRSQSLSSGQIWEQFGTLLRFLLKFYKGHMFSYKHQFPMRNYLGFHPCFVCKCFEYCIKNAV